MAVEVYGTEQLIEDLRADRCPAHGCEVSTHPNALLCGGHWRLVPADGRREVTEAVRRLERIGSRYDAADSTQKRRLADLYLEAEAEMREAQLRAVIVASERAGAR